jgi:primary-amine oxidase
MVEKSHVMTLNGPSVQSFRKGYNTKNEIVETATPLDLDIANERVFEIINEQVSRMANAPVGYKLIPQPSQKVLAHPSSHHFQ